MYEMKTRADTSMSIWPNAGPPPLFWRHAGARRYPRVYHLVREWWWSL